MFDFGLLGGWAAGGVAVEAGNTAKSPAGVVDAADADVAALAGAFRELVDAFAGGPAESKFDAASVHSASTAVVCAAPEALQSIELNSVGPAPAVPVDGALRPRFMVSALSAKPADVSNDNQNGLQIPLPIAPPLCELRLGADRSTKVPNDSVASELESESADPIVDPVAMPPTALVTMTPIVAAIPAGIETPTAPVKAPVVAGRLESHLESPAPDTSRPTVRTEGHVRFAARQAEPSSSHSSSAPANAVDVDTAQISTSISESIPAEAAAMIVASTRVEGGASVVPPPAAESRKAGRIVEPRADAYRMSSQQTLRAAMPAAETGTDPQPGTNLETDHEAGREPATNASRLDFARPSGPVRNRDAAVLPDAMPAMSSAASRLAAGLVASSYVSGAPARPYISVSTNGAAPANNPPVVAIPFAVPPATASIAGLASRAAAPDMPAAAPDVDRAAPQIVQTIRLAWSRGGGEAHIRLDPRQFGDLSVSLRVEGGQVVARLQADAPAVREWLQTNQRTLQDQLAEHHLKLTRFEVVPPGEDAQDASGRGTREQQDETQGRPARRPKRHEHGEGFEVVA